MERVNWCLLLLSLTFSVNWFSSITSSVFCSIKLSIWRTEQQQKNLKLFGNHSCDLNRMPISWCDGLRTTSVKMRSNTELPYDDRASYRNWHFNALSYVAFRNLDVFEVGAWPLQQSFTRKFSTLALSFHLQCSSFCSLEQFCSLSQSSHLISMTQMNPKLFSSKLPVSWKKT